MTNAHTTRLGLRVLAIHPRLTLTEIQLVDGALLYRRVDGRDHIPSEVRAMRPSTADWSQLRHVLDEAGFWLWPRRWPRVLYRYEGEFVVAVSWAGRVAVSAGALGVAPEVGAVLDEVQQLASDARRRSLEAVPSLRSATLPPPLPAGRSGGADGACAARPPLRGGACAARITPR